jgi:YfiH family protein
MIQPRPATTFEWQGTPAGDALVCTPLARSARHLFTTRPWRLGAGPPGAHEDEWTDVARVLDVSLDRLRRVRQVHGAAVVVEKAGRPPAGRNEADIVATDNDAIALAIRTADCVPLLVADQRTGAIAAAHAGWRGLVLRVPSLTVDVLASEFGGRASDLVAAIGPSIGPCCYEIGDDVRERFEQAGFPASDVARWFGALPAPLPGNPAFPGLSPDRLPTKWFLDIWSVARDQLTAAGIPPQQIHVAALCTASHPDAFCSYRRDGPAAGRLAAAIRRV